MAGDANASTQRFVERGEMKPMVQQGVQTLERCPSLVARGSRIVERSCYVGLKVRMGPDVSRDISRRRRGWSSSSGDTRHYLCSLRRFWEEVASQ